MTCNSRLTQDLLHLFIFIELTKGEGGRGEREMERGTDAQRETGGGNLSYTQ